MKQLKKAASSQIIFKPKLSHLAVIAVLASLNTTAQANCTGAIASPASAAVTVLCTGTGTSGNLTNSAPLTDTTSTATAGNNTLIQFDGQGRTLNNTSDIINNRTITGITGAHGRTAILIGAATLNAGTGTVFTPATAPTAGATTVTLNAAPTTAYIGQTVVFGRYNAAEGDFSLGEQRVITAVNVTAKTITFANALPANFAGAGSDPAGYKVVSNYGAGDNILNNSGTISSQILASEITGNKTGSSPTITSVSYTAAVKAITASVEGDYVINNAASGVISAKHDGIGAAYGVEEGGAVSTMTINNKGLISAERTANLSLVDNLATGNPTATSSSFTGYTKQTVALVNAINTQEEANEVHINNDVTGIIRAKGDYAGAIYMRASEKTIENKGLIEHVGNKGFAIGAVSNPGSIRTLELKNAGTGIIKGDILAVNGNALRWYLLSTEGGVNGINSRLTINSQYGQSDSAIENKGQIIGNLYYSNGTHTLNNEAASSIAGNIDVDQRNTVGLVSGVATNAALAGTKSFSFENAGTYTGNITVRTATGSNITLIPTITGSGSGSNANTPSSNIADMGGVLKIFDGVSTSTANLATVAPKSLVTVHAGEYFKVANDLFGTTLPQIDNVNTPLVNWLIAKNASNNLVIGVDAVNSASTVTGVSSSSATVIDALLSSNTAIGGAVQSTSSSAKIEAAGRQLNPETNGAIFQAANTSIDSFTQVVGTHLASKILGSDAATGIATGDNPADKSFWLQGFGFAGAQDKRNNADGYDVDSYGFAAGLDKDINDDLRLGAAIAYANTDTSAKASTQGNTNQVDTYSALVYGTQQFGTWYLDGQLGYAKHQFDSRRLITVPVADVVKGSFDANQYFAKIGASYPLHMNNTLTLVPTAIASYSYLDQDGYTETSTLGSALTVNGRSTDSFRTGLGAKAIFNIGEEALPIGLEARALWWHEFADVAQDTTAHFAAGGTAFNVEGIRPARDAANLGLSLKASAKDGSQSLAISYDADLRNQYLGHTASLTARFNF